MLGLAPLDLALKLGDGETPDGGPRPEVMEFFRGTDERELQQAREPFEEGAPLASPEPWDATPFFRFTPDGLLAASGGYDRLEDSRRFLNDPAVSGDMYGLHGEDGITFGPMGGTYRKRAAIKTIPGQH